MEDNLMGRRIPNYIGIQENVIMEENESDNDMQQSSKISSRKNGNRLRQPNQNFESNEKTKAQQLFMRKPTDHGMIIEDFEEMSDEEVQPKPVQQ